jgi:uncharacterized protein involved in exopolysaccharide biosynthesis/Mrp family chromosome partitioning ATPase
MKRLKQTPEADFEDEAEDQGSGFNVNEILIILFKHKWKILVCAAIGLVAAAVVYMKWPRLYVSEAKLMVQYVLDKSVIDPESAGGARRDDSILNSELEILTSWDLALKVAEDIGMRRLVPEAGDAGTVNQAAGVISGGLAVFAGRSNVISVSYKNPNPELAPLVLTELIENYFKKHLEVHRSPNFDFVAQQNLLVQANLRTIEDELKQRKGEAKITSLTDSFVSLSRELADCQGQVNSAEAELASQQAMLKLMEGSLNGPDADGPLDAKDGLAARPPDFGDVQRYQSLVKNLAQLRDLELALRQKYTGENKMLRLNQAQIEELEKERKALEKKIPNITVKAKPTDFAAERALLAGIEARLGAWKTRLQKVETRITELSALAPKINELERKKQIEEDNNRASIASLEKARLEEALDPSKMPNIKVVQHPSPARLDLGKAMKVVLGLAGGGIACGIGLALLIEFLLDRRIKRPLEVETVLGIPLILSVPKIAGVGRLRLKGRGRRPSPWATAEEGAPPGGLAPWSLGHFIRRYAESIRDRLIMDFQLNGLSHKPKLVAVTGVLGGEGTSTIAGGLAAALSETGDGKVLLVDMNPANAGAHPFFNGKPSSSIADALQGSESATEAADNLFLATTNPLGEGAKHLFPKRFYEMVPNFRASDYDYIIFDMPPLSQSAATLAVAGAMDKVLLVVEAEKGGRDLTKRACSELAAARANVSGIFNKARSYGPKWLRGDEVGSLALPWTPSDDPAVVVSGAKSNAVLR